MTPELLAEWKRIVETARLVIDKRSDAILATDAELEALREQVMRLVDALTLLEALPIHELYRVYPLTREALASTDQSAREWLEARDKAAYERGAKDALRDVIQAVARWSTHDESRIRSVTQ